MNTLEFHINSVEGMVVVVYSIGGYDRFRDTLIQYADRVESIPVDQLELFVHSSWEGLQLIIVIGKNLAEARELHAQCEAFKHAQIPVVYGNPERFLFTEAPNWQTADLLMPGMFFLADQYAISLPRKRVYAAFGVYDGRSFSLAYHALNAHFDTFYAFDSFAGMVGSREDELRLYPEGSYAL